MLQEYVLSLPEIEILFQLETVDQINFQQSNYDYRKCINRNYVKNRELWSNSNQIYKVHR